MAMVNCKECGKEVSNTAKECPHCGIKNPGMDAKTTAKGCLGIIIFALLFAGVMSVFDDSTDDTASHVTNTECKLDLQCWAEKNIIQAGASCQKPIQKMGQFDHEWTDGITAPRFGYYRWKNESEGQVTYIGDQIKFQNGFGAWSHYKYECDFDPARNLVLDVRGSQGRL